MKRTEVAISLKTARNLCGVEASHCKDALAMNAKVHREIPADSHVASSRYDAYFIRNAPLHLSSFNAGFLRGTFLANRIRKPQGGRPTVKNNDSWNPTAKSSRSRVVSPLELAKARFEHMK